MKELRFKKIDAFAANKSEGNPAGYIRLDSETDISENEMRQIACELKGFVNEVGYVRQTGENSFDLKYYSSEREVDFCGHATIAIMYDLVNSSDKLKNYSSLSIQTNRGKLEVLNRIAQDNAVFIMSPVPMYRKEIPGTAEIAASLRIPVSEIDNSMPVKLINAGLWTLIVPIKNSKTILSIFPDFNELKNFCTASSIDIIEVFTKDAVDKSNDFRARVFAPAFGYLEDPATGSGNCAFGYYLLDNNMWHKETVIIEQNDKPDKYNIVKLQKKRGNNKIWQVLFGGGAVTRIEGTYILY
ncbi:MAG: PhzF family phenazine biosynthesis protein [Bacteroidetes bacterium]|nr:PhzF family phenazine biosynthesis protein [Bacteroidota bacterium]